MLSVAQSAEILGVSAVRVRQLISSGALSAQRVGRSWVLSEKDVYGRLAQGPQAGRPSKSQREKLSDNVDLSDGQLLPQAPDFSLLYEECKASFTRRPTAQELRCMQNQEEAAFRVALSDFFLQQKQRELVEAGVY